ncbi:hypothetical protein [Pararhizobium sp. PWRC1-1]|uniref:hypothetical protein n=1 Tax=Pararhizobium sp. PWRC1-1 TaxID=2804566 RepID=UPI003CED8A28
MPTFGCVPYGTGDNRPSLPVGYGFSGIDAVVSDETPAGTERSLPIAKCRIMAVAIVKMTIVIFAPLSDFTMAASSFSADVSNRNNVIFV